MNFMLRGYISYGSASSDSGFSIIKIFGVLCGKDGFLLELRTLLDFEEEPFARLLREEEGDLSIYN